MIITDFFHAYGKEHHFTAHHYLDLAEEVRTQHKIADGEFLIQLTFDEETRVFKVFRNEDEPMQWMTNASTLIIDKASVDVIGSIIDEHHF